MCLLTSIIIFAGVFASWTVKERSQEFYALLLTAGHRRLRRLRLARPVRLLPVLRDRRAADVPAHRHLGLERARCGRRASSAGRSAETGVGTKEYAAMKLTLYLLFGSAFILVGILALYVGGRVALVLVPRAGGDAVRSRRCSRWVFLAFYVGLRHPGRHLAAAHLVARRPRLGAHRGVDAARRRADEARRLRRGAAGHGAAARRRPSSGRGSSATIACINIVYGALSARWRRPT